MATKKSDPTQDEAASPLLQSIDPRQAAANNLTATPDETDTRNHPGTDQKDNPAAPNDLSNVVDPSDQMTLTGEDAQPGQNQP